VRVAGTAGNKYRADRLAPGDRLVDSRHDRRCRKRLDDLAGDALVRRDDCGDPGSPTGSPTMKK
jgi:hypothetical protein